MEDEIPFLFRSPFRPDQRAEAIQRNVASIERDLQFIQTHGYDEFTKQRMNHQQTDELNDKDEDPTPENLGSSFEGSLRDYQIYMLEKAREENIIAHLGTGMGKTLISIFLIRDFLSRRKNDDNGDDGRKHILFLVPSIALAVQHTDTLKANLPCVVATACHTSSHSSKAREEIADADVIVATHGTALDLLRHYPDILSMNKVDLLVIDECHYATGNHNYAKILEKHYHSLPSEERPRVLGLTASPLINLRINDSESRLRMLLSEFERTMDARLFGFPSDISTTGGLGKKDAEESAVAYNSQLDSFNTNLPPAQWNSLHKSRKKEIAQLQDLCHEVGLRVTAVYAATVMKEIGRNEFDRETPAQFENLKAYLGRVAFHLNRSIEEGRGGVYKGHTNKMKELEELLKDAVKPVGDLLEQKAPVGIVFVERRITAIALHNYFCHTFRLDNAHTQSPSASMGSQFNDSKIRCDVVVRQATQIFKYLGRQGSVNDYQLKHIDDDWVHQTKRIRTVIKKLRCRETNVLIATSVVEEGVDVEACQFILAFNGLTTIKSYVQMKGRARQKNARFFVFVDISLDKSQPLSLNNAQTMENVIHSFIAENQNDIQLGSLPTIPNITERSFSSAEEGAMHYGKYDTSMSSADLSSSKSLLNRYALSVPLEPNSRSSKEATTLHMPIYTENELILPSHLPPTIRKISLPIVFRGESKKKKHSLLALAACVRLHKLGLLNDRLLPLSTSDMKEWLLERAIIDLPSCKRQRPISFEPPHAVYVYSISQTGGRFEEVEMEVCTQEPGEMRLAIISLSLLPENLPAYYFKHKELGVIECGASYCGKIMLSKEEWNKLTGFHSILFNSRWRQRRKKSKWFCFDDSIFEDQDRTFAPYVIGCLDAAGDIDWVRIRTTIAEFSRSSTARENAAQGDSMVGPTIWSPSYNQGVSYIVYGPSGKVCSDPFPNEDYLSFQDYYAKKYGIEISPNGEMYQARRMWEFPQTLSAMQVESLLEDDIRYIPTVDVPQELFAESLVTNPVIMLHSIVLPQLLYQLESYLTVASFMEHCLCNFPILGQCLSELSIESVMEALTAKSCCLDVTYDRLEWLGDAVLKLLHTDSLLKWEHTSYLHEGYLTMIRSELGCNDHLKDITKAAGFERFILLKPLNRAEWCPFGLRYCKLDKHGDEQAFVADDTVQRQEPSDKVYADVIEALIGLVFIEFGYEQCVHIGYEMGVSFRPGNEECRRWSDMSPDQNLVSFACDFVGVSDFLNPHLLVEATTHQSCLHKPVPSYQRLEWVGDAVLCLAAREWLFRREESLCVSKLVVLETTLVCNESLAYLGYVKGLHRFIDHRNVALPGHFQSYQLDLETGRGLWSTDPPKVIPDVIEALIGAVHIDSGLNAGQKAALCVIAPLLKSISCMLGNESNNLTSLLHPKQNLYEMTGGIISARVYKKDVFHKLGFPSPLLCEFGSYSSVDGGGYVGVVKCKRVILSVAVEASKLAAINVVCELTVQMLKERPHIISELQDMLSAFAK